MTSNASIKQTTDRSALDTSVLNQRLQSIRIVMVNTTLPANIGSAARAMLTMGLTDLVVVDPKHPIDEDSVAHAAGAKSVLDNCTVVESLEQALADCQLVFAASSRQRHIPRPVVTPDDAAKLILSRPTEDIKVAVLFGREDRGLTNQELAMADYHIQIDANPDYPVLNVASAIQVISSFFYSRFLQDARKPTVSNPATSLPSLADNTSTTSASDQDEGNKINVIQRQNWDAPAITQDQKSNLQSRIIELMKGLELVESTEPDTLRELPNRLSRLLSRVQLDQKEFEIISSIIAKIKRKL
ncbi:RNA methyltransferase [Psychrobacter sanguinis]|uniref:RNA methyltransferase n=1 Tax=Psychrobacter sanguinis TaxID=861445 RepID=UPI002A75BFDB|nr:RNA methyltransferase [Psychrobacter sanguinis]MDY3306220.1 RNA methyltransferase [Psychrobacter sanguinis]